MHRPTAASNSDKVRAGAVTGRTRFPCGKSPAMAGNSSVVIVPNSLSTLPRPRVLLGCCGSAASEIGKHLRDVGAGEIAAVIAVQDRREAAHRSGWVALAPDRLPQRQRGLQRSRVADEHGEPGDG